uniref:Uncharacterized protein n=1 Tax=Lutzomyia longipalpis TaxID=7200 RepID=A0A1B0GLH4_LUTLO
MFYNQQRLRGSEELQHAEKKESDRQAPPSSSLAVGAADKEHQQPVGGRKSESPSKYL